MGLTDDLTRELQTARQRTLQLLAPLDEAALRTQHSPLMSPLVWDLAHIGNYEDLWLLRALGAPGLGEAWDDLYDAFKHPRRDRPALPLLGPTDARRYLERVRDAVLDLLPRRDDELVRDAFLYRMVVQHEHQHGETMLATLQLMAAPGYRPRRPASLGGPSLDAPSEVFVEGGAFVMGTDDDPWAYDNERPAHTVHVPSFFIDTTPVANATYLTFVEAGGYDDERWWTPAGWAWRQEADLRHPQFWVRDGAGWARDRFGWLEPLALDEPVQHVCWYEADACARFLGKRLPTEAEWEKAATWDPTTGAKRRFPWGDGPPTPARATLAHAGEAGVHHTFGPAPVGAHPAGASAYGCLAMIGDVWEWTASDFTPYPGFVAHPYREYSEVFYGPEYKVLRGGSWAVHPSAVRGTFRNWDYPIRRQIFAGFRCARDAEPGRG